MQTNTKLLIPQLSHTHAHEQNQMNLSHEVQFNNKQQSLAEECTQLEVFTDGSEAPQ